MNSRLLLLLAVILWTCNYSCGVVSYHSFRQSRGYDVTYDNRSFIIGGERTLLLSGSVHYPRVPADEWGDVLKKMVLDGLNTVQTYVYWNLHQSQLDANYDFSGNKNLSLFVETAAEVGLFVTLRIGPFVASEWDYGGIPHWINNLPGMYVRSNNSLWEKTMQTFFSDIVEIVRPLTAPFGGPIILGQVENEFHWNDTLYVDWCGELVRETKPGIPFLMCNGYSAKNTINTYNGDDGSTYADNHGQNYPGQPLAWTENEGWFQSWDKEYVGRTPQDMAFVVMKWFARGGAYHNYYMWYGGNNFGRMAGSCVVTAYADEVNLHSDGLDNEPKKTHLARLHDLLATYSYPLLSSPSKVDNVTKVLVYNTSVGKFVTATSQCAYVYGSAGGGVAFIENSVNTTVLVQFMHTNFTLPGLSSSLVDLSTVALRELYNSGKVSSYGLPTERVYTAVYSNFEWEVWQENVSVLEGAISLPQPLEQLSITQDLTDYLFYQTVITSNQSGLINLTLNSRISNSFVAFVDGQFQDCTGYCTHNEGYMNYTLNITLGGKGKKEKHQLTLLSVSLGVNTHTDPGEFDLKGITGDVFFGEQNITEGTWLHRPKLAGEILEVFTMNGSNSVDWDSSYAALTGEPVVWYRWTFTTPTVSSGSSLLLDLNGMNRGYVYVNEVNLGRYWLIQLNGAYVQRYYYVPQSLLLPGANLLVLFEELGAPAPQNVRMVTSTFVIPS